MLLVAFPAYAYEMSPAASRTMSAGTAIIGTVMSVNVDFGEVQVNDTGNVIRSYYVADAPIITKRGRAVDVSVIKTGDTVVIEIGADNRVKKVTMTN